MYYNALHSLDECAKGTHSCQQQCQNTAGSYTCSCSSGYTLDSNGRTCTQNAQNSPDSLCGGTLTGNSGTFETPGYPNSYPQRDFQCEWTIQAPSSSRRIYFRIDSSSYGINGRSPCNSDNLEFFDGTGSNANSMAKVCGLTSFYSQGLPTVLTTTSSAKVVFTGTQNSNRPASRVGVRVNYWIL